MDWCRGFIMNNNYIWEDEKGRRWLTERVKPVDESKSKVVRATDMDLERKSSADARICGVWDP